MKNSKDSHKYYRVDSDSNLQHQTLAEVEQLRCNAIKELEKCYKKVDKTVAKMIDKFSRSSNPCQENSCILICFQKFKYGQNMQGLNKPYNRDKCVNQIRENLDKFEGKVNFSRHYNKYYNFEVKINQKGLASRGVQYYFPRDFGGNKLSNALFKYENARILYNRHSEKGFWSDKKSQNSRRCVMM